MYNHVSYELKVHAKPYITFNNNNEDEANLYVLHKVVPLKNQDGLCSSYSHSFEKNTTLGPGLTALYYSIFYVEGDPFSHDMDYSINWRQILKKIENSLEKLILRNFQKYKWEEMLI